MLFRIMKASNPIDANGSTEESHRPCKNAFLHQYPTGEKVWMIRINTLEELIALRDEVQDELIIGLNDWITVYDACVEG